MLQPRRAVYMLKRKAERFPFTVIARDADQAIECAVKEYDSLLGSLLDTRWTDRKMNRWVGIGVIADNVVNIGGAMEHQPAT